MIAPAARPSRAAPPRPSGAAAPGTLPAIADARDGAFGTFALTELGTSERLAAREGENIRYVDEIDAWLVWEDGHWIWDRDGSRTRCLAAGLRHEIYAEAADAPRGADVQYVAWARKCQTESTIRHVVSLASDLPRLRVALDDVDGDMLLAGVDGGRQVVELATGRVRPATRADLVTRSLAVRRVGDSSAARRWLRFLAEVFEADADMIDWVHRWLGYCLSGLNREHIFLFAHGLGANGKTVLLDTCAYLWGDYVRTAQPDTLMAQIRTGSGPSPDLARLAGARLVLASETEEGRPLAEALVKQLTGGDRVTARDMYSKPFEFEPRFKMILMGNHRPTITGTDNGIWRRIRLVPFSRIFAAHEQDSGLAGALRAEAEHITAWLIEGCGEYLRRGLADVPATISGATSAYRDEQDVVGDWVGERTSLGSETQANILYDDFKRWSEASGHRPMSVQAFGRRLAERGFAKRRTAKGALYTGLGLKGVLDVLD